LGYEVQRVPLRSGKGQMRELGDMVRTGRAYDGEEREEMEMRIDSVIDVPAVCEAKDAEGPRAAS